MSVEPIDFDDIAGGREAFDAACAELSIAAALGQNWLAEALDRIGPPGQARWDPIVGQIELRERTFEAQQLGSFDGQSWLWSWANPHLEIPEEQTTVARALRDRAKDIPALAVPSIATADEGFKYIVGGIAVALGLGDAYWIANQSQVYLLAPGQLGRPKDAPLDRLRAARDAVAAEAVPCDLRRALPFAAKKLGVTCELEARRVIVRDGKDELVTHLDDGGRALGTIATCFVPRSTTMAAILSHLRERAPLGREPGPSDSRHPWLAQAPFVIAGDVITLEGPSFAIRISRSDRLREVMRRASRVGPAQEDAKKFGAVLTIEAVHGPDHGAYGIGGGMFGRSWVPLDLLAGPDGGAPVGPQVGANALAICERLNQLPEALVYDELLTSMYPRH